MIVEALYDHLTADGALSALVNGVFPHVIPEDQQPPAVTFRQGSDERDQQLDGQGAYRKAIFDIDCWSLRYDDALKIADAVEASLIDYRGILGTTSPSIDADHIRLERRGPDLLETDTEFYRVPLQILIGYEEQ